MQHFEDTVEIDAPIEVVYHYIFAADQWPQFLPHVVRTALDTNVQGEQLLTMDTRVNGQLFTTRSIRTCVPHEEITFSQITRPSWMAVHMGRWLFSQKGGSTQITVCHDVEIDEQRFSEVPGNPRSLAEAYQVVSSSLLRNSRITMFAIKGLVERSPAGMPQRAQEKETL